MTQSTGEYDCKWNLWVSEMKQPTGELMTRSKIYRWLWCKCDFTMNLQVECAVESDTGELEMNNWVRLYSKLKSK